METQMTELENRITEAIKQNQKELLIELIKEHKNVINAQLEQQDAKIKQLDAKVKQQDAVIKQQAARIKHLDAQVEQQDAQMEEQQERINDIDDYLRKLSDFLASSPVYKSQNNQDQNNFGSL